MGYVNPARSSPVEVTLMTVGGSGHGSFYGLVKARSPLKMISYGVVKYSGLAQAREVHSKTGVLSVKSINIFPLPGEWERAVGFFGTCAKAAQLLFSPFQGALSYTTRMIPAPGTGSASKTNLILIHIETDFIPGKLQEPILLRHQDALKFHLAWLPVRTLEDYPYHGTRVRLFQCESLPIC